MKRQTNKEEGAKLARQLDNILTKEGEKISLKINPKWGYEAKLRDGSGRVLSRRRLDVQGVSISCEDISWSNYHAGMRWQYFTYSREISVRDERGICLKASSSGSSEGYKFNQNGIDNYLPNRRGIQVVRQFVE